MQQQAPVDVGDTRWFHVAEILYVTAGVGFFFSPSKTILILYPSFFFF